MVKRITAILLIFAATAVAWLVLGGTIFHRTYSSDARSRERVASTWGAPQTQAPPIAHFERSTSRWIDKMNERGKSVREKVEQREEIPLELESSRVNIAFNLEHRQKGLLWYSTYKVDFSGAYTFRNHSEKEELVTLTLKFPAEQAIYDDLVLLVNGEPLPITSSDRGASTRTRVGPKQTVSFQTSYRSHGLESWRYNFGSRVSRVRDFALTMKTNFKDIDFPGNTLSPTEKREVGDGWELAWRYKNLVSGFEIGMTMPEKLQPGPLAGEISLFAPVSLFFFFFLMFIITTIRNVELHPMNYFFLAAAFFAFHLLLAYLVDHISIHLAFIICSAVSIFLVVSYLRLVVGMRFAAVEAGISQFIYLVLFSYAFFFKGFTGLAVTIGSIITLFFVMQVTGRIRWAEKFERRPAPAPSWAK